MAGLSEVSSNARAFGEGAEGARRLARSSSGQVQGELLEIAELYQLLAACNDPERQMSNATSGRAQPQTK